MAYQCTCIKNIFDLHVQTKVHISWTTPLYSNSGLYIKVHICRGLTHKKSNFLLFSWTLMLFASVYDRCASLATANK